MTMYCALALLLVPLVAGDDALIAWLRNNGGVFSEKVHFQHLDPDDTSSPNGLFAAQDLEEGETIMLIPHHCLLTTPPPHGLCQTARALADHKRQGDQSFFKDYVNYLFDGTKHRMLPYRWSDDAKEIMKQITGRELHSPVVDQSFAGACGDDGGPLEEDAFEFIVSRSWEEVMIPLYDMVNHRNGRWRNVEATSAHIGEAVKVYAYRDIKANEQLYNTYNECEDVDCQGLFFEYGTQEILGDYGFVENFPQRWIWQNIPGLDDDEGEPLMLEIDEVESSDPYNPEDNSTQYEVTWHTAVRPNIDVVSFMTAHARRLDSLKEDLLKATAALGSQHERYTIREYYESLKLALKLTNWAYYDEAVEELADVEGSGEGRHYDTLSEARLPLGHLESYPETCHPDHTVIGPGYKTIFVEDSHYQQIEFRHGEEEDDTCLWLSDWAQTCTSFRQYHEALVHYPASFVSDVKRVAYIGGGDNMILHEILKYPSIELVLGFELDQQVVRYSFLNLGTLPYFDDPRVQWWFGDATKSLLMLPEEYFGSFDLVLVDLQTFVGDALFVTDKLSIMDTCTKLLMNPTTGIISKNEDFPNRQLTSFARYTVAMEYTDLPQIGRQSISIGSNGVNFVTAPQFEHDIHRLYMNETLETAGRFNHWYDFRDNLELSSSEKEASMTTAGSEEVENGIWSPPSHGILVVVDAENLDGSTKDGKSLMESLKEVLTSEDFNVLSTNELTYANSSAFDVVIAYDEGYLVARQFNDVNNYLALDLVFWSGLDKANAVKSKLFSVIGGNEKNATSFRLVVGGIEGGSITQSFLGNYSALADDSCENPDIESASSESLATSSIWPLAAQWFQANEKSSVVVLCGPKNNPCTALDLLKTSSAADVVVPIYPCDDIDPLDDSTFFSCEGQTVRALRSAGLENLVGVVLGDGAPQFMARILLRLITGFSAEHGRLLSETNYVVVTEIVHDEPWRSVFVDRFRTEISPIAPAKEAILTSEDGKEYAVFASGDASFYANLTKAVQNMNADPSTQDLSIKSVMSGHAAYVPNFDPPFFNNGNYDNTRAYTQWKNQKALGVQVVLQLELQAPTTPLKEGETVLWQYYEDIWVGQWAPARVLHQNDDLTYDIESLSDGIEEGVSRHTLRRLDFDAFADSPPVIDIGTRVLIQVSREHWRQGFVVSRFPDDMNYRVRVYSGEGEVLSKNIKNLIPQMEKTHEDVLPLLSMISLNKAFKKSLSKLMSKEDFVNLKHHEQSIRKGGLVSYLWSGGSAILVWNGGKRVDINLHLKREDDEAMLDFQRFFVRKFPFMTIMARDEHPRGYGGVVNFDSDIKRGVDPIWWHGSVA